MTQLPHFPGFRMSRLLVAGGLAFAATVGWAAGPRGTSQLGVSVTLVDQCAVGSPAGANTSWQCTNGTTATLAYGLRSNASGTYRLLASTSASASNAPAAQGSSEPVRLTIMFEP